MTAYRSYHANIRPNHVLRTVATNLPRDNRDVSKFGNNTRKNAQVVTGLQTNLLSSVHKLSTSCVRPFCSLFIVTSLEQPVNNL